MCAQYARYALKHNLAFVIFDAVDFWLHSPANKTVAIENSGDNDALIIGKIELHAITFDRFVYAYAHKTIVNLLFDRCFFGSFFVGGGIPS